MWLKNVRHRLERWSMKTRFLVLIFLLIFFPGVVLSQELEGSFTDTGGEGSYLVNLENDLGHVYIGTAVDRGDGTLKVFVSDGGAENYTGIATPDATSGFNFELKNNVTGETSDGSADVFAY